MIEDTKGAMILGAFSPDMRRLLVGFIQRRGDLALTDADKVQMNDVMLDPAFGFLSPRLNPDMLASLLRMLKLLLTDAMQTQWDGDKYALAISRMTGAPLAWAKKLAEDRILTPDVAELDFARRLLYKIPDLPTSIDDGIKSALGFIIGAFERTVYGSGNTGQDVLVEWKRGGDVLKDFGERSILVRNQVTYINAPVEMTPDQRDQAIALIPAALKVLIGTLGHRLEGGDVFSPIERGEIYNLLTEGGDLAREAIVGFSSPEQGGLFGKRFKSFLKGAVNVVRKAGSTLAPLAGAIIPGGGILTKGITSMLGSGHVSDHDDAAMRGAENVAAGYPRASLPASSSSSPNSSWSLNDLYRMLQQQQG